MQQQTTVWKPDEESPFGDFDELLKSLVYDSVHAECEVTIKRLQSELAIIYNRDRTDFFSNCEAVSDVKLRYLSLVNEFNFYGGGDEKIMYRIQDQYTAAIDAIIMRSELDWEDMVKQFDSAALFIETIAILSPLTNIKTEILDGYMWVSSADYHSIMEIRTARMGYSKKKEAWFHKL